MQDFPPLRKVEPNTQFGKQNSFKLDYILNVASEGDGFGSPLRLRPFLKVEKVEIKLIPKTFFIFNAQILIYKRLKIYPRLN